MGSTLLTSLLGAAAELTKTWKQMIITVIFIGLVSLGMLGYQYAATWIGEYNHYSDIVDRLHLDEKVQGTLRLYREMLNADRIVVGELHDGKVNMSGIRFGYVSATYEVTSPGVAHIITQMQNMPTSMFAGYWNELIAGDCATLSRSKAATLTPTMEAFMMDNGIKHIIFCPIDLPGQKDKIIGISMGMWMNNDYVENLVDFKDTAQEMSLVISGAIMRKG